MTRKEYYAKNREKILKQQRVRILFYRMSNFPVPPSMKSEYRKTYFNANKEHILSRQREYYRKRREIYLEKKNRTKVLPYIQPDGTFYLV